MNTIRNFFYATMSVLALGSCVSVTSYHVTPEQDAWLRAQSAHAADIEARASKLAHEEEHRNPAEALRDAHALCPVYVPPALPDVPDPNLSSDQIRHLTPNDNAGLDSIALSQIHALYANIKQSRKLMHTSYDKYLHDCMNGLPQLPPVAPEK